VSESDLCEEETDKGSSRTFSISLSSLKKNTVR
jgi:hypothetical protein